MTTSGTSDPQQVIAAERRKESYVATGALLGALLFGFLAFRPDPAAQSLAEMKKIVARERQAMTAFQSIVATAKGGQVSEAALAERVDREVLVPWREARQRVDAAREGPLAPYFPAELADYFRLRQESWEALVAGVRTGDTELALTHRERWAEADRVAATIPEAFVRARERARRSFW